MDNSPRFYDADESHINIFKLVWRTVNKQLQLRADIPLKQIKHVDKSALASHVWTENHKTQKGRKLLKQPKFPEELTMGNNFHQRKPTQNSKFIYPQQQLPHQEL